MKILCKTIFGICTEILDFCSTRESTRLCWRMPGSQSWTLAPAVSFRLDHACLALDYINKPFSLVDQNQSLRPPVPTVASRPCFFLCNFVTLKVTVTVFSKIWPQDPDLATISQIYLFTVWVSLFFFYKIKKIISLGMYLKNQPWLVFVYILCFNSFITVF